MDLSVALTEKTLSFYQQLLRHPSVSMRIAAATVIRTFVAKGMQDPAQRIQVLRILGVVALLDPLEQETRGQDDEEVTAFRTVLAGVLAVYGQTLVDFYDTVSLSTMGIRRLADVGVGGVPGELAAGGGGDVERDATVVVAVHGGPRGGRDHCGLAVRV